MKKVKEEGVYLGYDYRLLKGKVFWTSYFKIGNAWVDPMNLNLTKDKAKKNLFKKISNFHFQSLIIKSGKNYD